jgi:hypothetical protein
VGDWSLLFLTGGGLPEAIIGSVDTAARLAWQRRSGLLLIAARWCCPAQGRCTVVVPVVVASEIGAQLVISASWPPRSAALPLAVASAAVIGSRPLAGLPRAGAGCNIRGWPAS